MVEQRESVFRPLQQSEHPNLFNIRLFIIQYRFIHIYNRGERDLLPSLILTIPITEFNHCN